MRRQWTDNQIISEALWHYILSRPLIPHHDKRRLHRLQSMFDGDEVEIKIKEKEVA